MKFDLEKVQNDDMIPVLASKLFGMPDLTYDFDWPTVDVDGEQFDLEFLAQINAEDVAGLGKKGVYYLFYDLYALSEGEELSKESIAVVYDPEPKDAARCSFVSETGEADEDYDESATGVYKIAFGSGNNVFAEEKGDGKTILFSIDFPHTEYLPDGKRLSVVLPTEEFKKDDFKNAELIIE